MKRIPTVKFDTSRLTARVLADLEHIIRKLPEIHEQNFDEFYELALRSIAAGGDLHLFSTGILALNIAGMTSQRAAQISTRIWLRASGKSELARQAELGITHARWMYSNAPCMVDPKNPTPDDRRQDAAHKAVNEELYVIGEGLVVDSRRTWPGDENGCRCWSRPVVEGFED
jgi:hypothetical protein